MVWLATLQALATSVNAATFAVDEVTSVATTAETVFDIVDLCQVVEPDSAAVVSNLLYTAAVAHLFGWGVLHHILERVNCAAFEYPIVVRSDELTAFVVVKSESEFDVDLVRQRPDAICSSVVVATVAVNVKGSTGSAVGLSKYLMASVERLYAGHWPSDVCDFAGAVVDLRDAVAMDDCHESVFVAVLALICDPVVSGSNGFGAVDSDDLTTVSAVVRFPNEDSAPLCSTNADRLAGLTGCDHN